MLSGFVLRKTEHCTVFLHFVKLYGNKLLLALLRRTSTCFVLATICPDLKCLSTSRPFVWRRASLWEKLVEVWLFNIAEFQDQEWHHFRRHNIDHKYIKKWISKLPWPTFETKSGIKEISSPHSKHHILHNSWVKLYDNRLNLGNSELTCLHILNRTRPCFAE